MGWSHFYFLVQPYLEDAWPLAPDPVVFIWVVTMGWACLLPEAQKPTTQRTGLGTTQFSAFWVLEKKIKTKFLEILYYYFTVTTYRSYAKLNSRFLFAGWSMTCLKDTTNGSSRNSITATHWRWGLGCPSFNCCRSLRRAKLWSRTYGWHSTGEISSCNGTPLTTTVSR